MNTPSGLPNNSPNSVAEFHRMFSCEPDISMVDLSPAWLELGRFQYGLTNSETARVETERVESEIENKAFEDPRERPPSCSEIPLPSSTEVSESERNEESSAASHSAVERYLRWTGDSRRLATAIALSVAEMPLPTCQATAVSESERNESADDSSPSSLPSPSSYATAVSESERNESADDSWPSSLPSLRSPPPASDSDRDLDEVRKIRVQYLSGGRVSKSEAGDLRAVLIERRGDDGRSEPDDDSSSTLSSGGYRARLEATRTPTELRDRVRGPVREDLEQGLNAPGGASERRVEQRWVCKLRSSAVGNRHRVGECHGR